MLFLNGEGVCMKILIKAAVVLGLMLLARGFVNAQGDNSGKAANASWDARLYNIRGKVYIQPAGGGKKWIPVTRGMPLMQGDRIGTGKSSKADVSLDDGGVVTVNQSSAVLLKSLKRKDASFMLNVGRILLKVPGLKKRLEKLQVRTPAAVAAVRGTEFAVSYDTITAESEVNVFDEGQVQVTSLDEDGDPVGEGVLLGPRHEVRVKKDMETLQPLELKDMKGWKSGFAETRGELSELKAGYRPIKEQERMDLRQDVLGAGSGVDSISGRGKAPQRTAEAAGGAQEKDTARNGAHAKNGQAADDRTGTEKGVKASGGKAGAAAAAGKKQDDDSDAVKGLSGNRGKSRRDAADDRLAKKGLGDGVKTKPGVSADTSLADKSSLLDSGSSTLASKKAESVASKLESRLAATGNSDLMSKDELRALVKAEMKDSPSDAVLNQRLTVAIAAKLAASQDTETLQSGSQIKSGFTPMTTINSSATNTKLTAPATSTKKKLVVQ